MGGNNFVVPTRLKSAYSFDLTKIILAHSEINDSIAHYIYSLSSSFDAAVS